MIAVPISDDFDADDDPTLPAVRRGALSIVAYADSIAVAMADGPWRAGPDPHGHSLRAYVARCDGPTFFIEVAGARIEVRGAYPRGVNGYNFTPHGPGAPHMTASARRPYLELAREIDRRFIPGFLAAHWKAVADVEAQRLALERARTVAADLASAAGGSVYRFDKRLQEEWTVHLPSGVIRVRASSPEQADIRFELHGVPEAEALRLARAVPEKSIRE